MSKDARNGVACIIAFGLTMYGIGVSAGRLIEGAPFASVAIGFVISMVVNLLLVSSWWLLATYLAKREGQP